MKREFLTELGIAEDIAAKIMAENGEDIKRENAKMTKAITERDAATKARDDLQTQLDDVQKQLKSMPTADDTAARDEQIKKLTDQLEQSQKQNAETAKAHADELAKIKRQGESKDFFSALKTPFVNDETREHYAAKLEAALDDAANRGKSRQEILDALTAGEDGKPRTGIYKEPENPNKLNIPPAGKVPPAKPGEEFKMNFVGVRPRQ